MIDVSGQKIEITCSPAATSRVSAPHGQAVDRRQQVKIKATSTLTLEAGGTMTLKGQTVAIN